jgi:hypothetical protein
MAWDKITCEPKKNVWTKSFWIKGMDQVNIIMTAFKTLPPLCLFGGQSVWKLFCMKRVLKFMFIYHILKFCIYYFFRNENLVSHLVFEENGFWVIFSHLFSNKILELMRDNEQPGSSLWDLLLPFRLRTTQNH